MRESIEINTSEMKQCNDMTHALIDSQCRKCLRRGVGKMRELLDFKIK